MNRGAQFDATGRYRYRLWREWDGDLPRVGIVMLNPSTADAAIDDPTIRRCMGLAQSWGYGSVEVVNLFAWRSPYPRALKHVSEPVGPDNDRYLLTASQGASMLVLAWGNWGCLNNRDRAVIDLLSGARTLYCLGRNQTGQPRHPLYLPRTIVPVPFMADAA